MKRISLLLAVLLLLGCSDDGYQSPVVANPQHPVPTNPGPANPNPTNPNPNPGTSVNYLALGDSYTIGQNVCETCRFPAQLKSRLQTELNIANVNLQIIATTGWTTTNLISGIQAANPSNDKDLVTLLIGVNNQYQHKPFSLFENEFPQLVDMAIALGQGDKNNVVVVSIPDYAYTPAGQGFADPSIISAELSQYNAFIEAYCAQNNIAFVNITDITQMGLENPGLVASDGLHPSETAYAQFVHRILPKALATLP